MRMTRLRKQVLRALRPNEDPDFVLTHGVPPYTASQLAGIIDEEDLSNLSRTLRAMEGYGLLTSETVERDVWAHLGRKGDVTKRLKGYWVAEHEKEDREALERILEGKAKRSEEALNKLMEMGR